MSLRLRLRQVWQRFTRRRSPARLVTGFMLLGVGALLAAAALLPYTWLAAFSQALALGTLLANYPLIFPVIAVPLVLVGLPLLLVPRTWHFANARRPDIAPVSVYFDFENQGVDAKALRPFVMQLHNYIGQHCGDGSGKPPRSDYFFYADALHYAGDVYRRLWSYGFRPIDTPHELIAPERTGTRTVKLKDTADMLIAMFAYERAILADGPRHIILITIDVDFIPLIYQLYYLGHHVHVLWNHAATSDQEKNFQVLMSVLPITAQRLLPELSANDPVQPQPGGSASAQKKAVDPATPSSTFPASMTADAFPAQSLAPLRAALAASLAWWQEAVAQKLDLATFRNQIITRSGADQLGYQDGAKWLHTLYDIRLLRPHEGQALPKAGAADIDAAVKNFDTIMDEVLETARILALAAPDQAGISLSDLRQRAASRPFAKRKESGGFRSLLTSEAVVRALVRCAAALGKIAAFTELEGPMVRITWRTADPPAATDSPDVGPAAR
jgi:hypothetical protein